MSFLKALVSPRFVSICAVIMGAWIYSLQTEARPLSTYLTEYGIYFIAFLIVVGVRSFAWIVVDKATFYDIKGVIKNAILEFFLFVIIMLSTVGTLFLWNSLMPSVF